MASSPGRRSRRNVGLPPSNICTHSLTGLTYLICYCLSRICLFFTSTLRRYEGEMKDGIRHGHGTCVRRCPPFCVSTSHSFFSFLQFSSITITLIPTHLKERESLRRRMARRERTRMGHVDRRERLCHLRRFNTSLSPKRPSPCIVFSQPATCLFFCLHRGVQ